MNKNPNESVDFEKVHAFIKELREKRTAICIDCGGTVREVELNGVKTLQCNKCGSILRECGPIPSVVKKKI